VKNRKLGQSNSNCRSTVAPGAWDADCLLPVFAFRVAFFVLLLISALAAQSPASAASQNEPFTVRVADLNGGVVAGVDIIVTRDGKVLDRMRSGTDGRASTQVSTGPLIVSIHQNGYIPIDQAVDPASVPEHLVEIRLLPTPQAHETVNVQASNEDITEQSSSAGALIKPEEANESPLRPLTLSDTLPLVPGVVRAPNGQTQIEGFWCKFPPRDRVDGDND